LTLKSNSEHFPEKIDEKYAIFSELCVKIFTHKAEFKALLFVYTKI